MDYKVNLIKKGKRRPKLIPDFISLFFFFGKKTITKYFNFTDGCDYNLGDEDQYDINKLFGFTFNTLPSITKMYNKLDNVILVKDSKILLYKQSNLDENGIYIVANNGTISRTDDLLTEKDAFRAKVNVKAGSNLDVEFHTFE